MKKLILLTLLLCGLNITYAQPGSLDPSFGNNGIVKTDIGSLYNYTNSGKKVLVNTDGSMYFISSANGLSLITKKHADGSADITYGNNGLSASVAIAFTDATLQPDGKIVIIGVCADFEGHTDVQNFAIARFNTDGSLDQSFNGDGLQTLNYGDEDTFFSVAIESNGKIICGGLTNTRDDGGLEISLVRLNTDGSSNQNINLSYESGIVKIALQSDGKIVIWNGIGLRRYNTDLTPDNSFAANVTSAIASISSIVIQSDDKIVVAGGAIARYNSDGSPDNAFDNDGIQVTPFAASSLAIQSDGKIVIAGGINNDFAVARYNADGSPDQSFDGDGITTTDFGSSQDYSNSIAVQSNGKLVALGQTINGPSTLVAVASYNSNGSPDNSFDGDGKLTDHISQGLTQFTSTAVQSDGKAVAAGFTWNGSNYDFAIVRYNTDGSLDNSFGDDGKRITDFGSTNDYINSIAIQSDGKIVAGGSAGDNFALARYNPDGSLDNTFDNDGLVTSDFGFSDVISKVVIQNDGKIVAGGSLIARYNADGSIDNSFNGNGKVFVNDPNGNQPAYSNSLAIQSDGKIIATGRTDQVVLVSRYNSDGSADTQFGQLGQAVIVGDDLGTDLQLIGKSISIQNDGKIIIGGDALYSGVTFGPVLFMVGRLNADGTFDATFNGGHIVKNSQSFDLHPNRIYDYATSVSVQNDNKIIIAGYSYDGQGDNFAIARYNADGSLDNSFSGDGLQLTKISAAYDRIAAIAISGNKLYAVGYGQYPGNLGVVARYLLDGNNQTPPVVSLTTPAHDTTYTAYGYIKITLNANASDADGTISKVDFYSNNTLLHSENVAPYSYIWHNVTAGNYTITAKATDNNGNETTSDAVHISVKPDIAPTVNITSPANDATYIAYSNITLSADANDVDGTVKKVDFYNGSALVFTETVAPYERKGYRLPPGNYSITAKATDNNGRVTTSQPVAISVVPNVAPVVSITSPANNTTYVAPATIILSADASDVDGTIKKVDFYNGSTLFHTENIAPYEFRLGYMPTGNYTLTAKATDNNGKTTTSAPVAISVVSAGKSMVTSDKSNSSKELLSLSLNPNPVANILNISVHGLQTNSKSAISVLSVSGAVIKTIQPGALNKNVQVDVSSLSGGVYFIKVVNGDKILYKQFVKL